MPRAVTVYGIGGDAVGEVVLPSVFEARVRPDLIKRAVLTIQSHGFQPQGRDPRAGKKTTAVSVGVGRGLSRVPRLKQSSRAAFASSVVGGLAAAAPDSEKVIRKKLNKKENRLAIISGVAATGDRNMISKRGHRIDAVKELPIILDDGIQGLQKTREVRDLFSKLGVWNDVVRTSDAKTRAGKGKMRNRRFKHRRGPLIVVAEDFGISEATGSLPGVEVVRASDLNVELLAPGAVPGRLTLWTRSALISLDTVFRVDRE